MTLLAMTRAIVALAAMLAADAATAETLDIGGVKRTFKARLPASKPAPLVIVLHGNTQTGDDMATRTSWPAVARREGFGVVFPDGLNRAWADLRPDTKRAGRTPPKGTDDVGFVVRLIGKYVADGTADPKRIYVTGVSNGGAMTMTMICARADLFAAAASVIINLTDESATACHPSRPVPMLMMNGTADPLIPYQGGRGSQPLFGGRILVDVANLRFLARCQRLRNQRCRRRRPRRPRPFRPDHGDAHRVALPAGARHLALPHQRRRPSHARRLLPTHAFRASQQRFSARKTTTSTAPKRYGRSSGDFPEPEPRENAVAHGGPAR